MKARKIILLLLTCFYLSFLNTVQAQSNYYLLYDNTYSSKVGAEDLLTIHKAFYSFEDKYLPPEIFIGNKKHTAYLNVFYRASKTIIDYPIQVFAKLTQHEVFGHGSRFREFDYDGISYNLNLTPPFGSGMGYTLAWSSPNHIITVDENISIDVAGVESNTILSDALRTKWILDDSTNYNDFFLYLKAHHNSTEYIFKTYYNNKSGDVSEYLGEINNKYANSSSTLTSENLLKYSIINLLDPYQFIAFYNWCGYIISGKQKGKMSMLKIGNVSYLPSSRLGLTPFGAEFYLDNYLKYKHQVYKVYGRIGDSKFENFLGAGLSAFNVIKNNYLYANVTVDFWNQPSLNLHNSDNYLSHLGSGGLGTCFSGTAGLNISKKTPVSIVVIGGYKTDGFLQGETLAQGFFFRAGLAFLNR